MLAGPGLKRLVPVFSKSVQIRCACSSVEIVDSALGFVGTGVPATGEKVTPLEALKLLSS